MLGCFSPTRCGVVVVVLLQWRHTCLTPDVHGHCDQIRDVIPRSYMAIARGSPCVIPSSDKMVSQAT